MNAILGRTHIENEITTILNNFEKMHKDVNYKKGIYIYGSSGVGKTTFILEILKKLNYDIIHYDAGDVRNKALIENIASNNISTCNVLDMMHKRVKKIAILMDEIDGMNSGDKGGLTALIKLIRQKKTKKQRLENMTLNPIICIGNYNMDKKIKELMKVCNVFELKAPTPEQMTALIHNTMAVGPEVMNPLVHPENIEKVINYALGDLRKLEFVKRLQHTGNLNLGVLLNSKTFNDDTNKITRALVKTKFEIKDHNLLMNETDRTTVALLWHENIVDVLPRKNPMEFYLKFLNNICFSDYIDRITFQNQIWHFNEMSSLIKTFYNNKLYHEALNDDVTVSNATVSNATVSNATVSNATVSNATVSNATVSNATVSNANCLTDVRFTKVLTKYSTEYNNTEFIYDMCQKLDMDKKDMFAFFQELRLYYKSHNIDVASDTNTLNILDTYFENYDITKLDIKRIYRFLDCNVKKDIVQEEEDD